MVQKQSSCIHISTTILGMMQICICLGVLEEVGEAFNRSSNQNRQQREEATGS